MPSKVASCRDSDPTLASLDLSLGGTLRAAVHLPDIVHASFARFIGVCPSSPGGESSGESADGSSGRSGSSGSNAGDLAERFAVVAEAFLPFRVPVAALTLANEVSPYMHQRRTEGTVRIFELPQPGNAP